MVMRSRYLPVLALALAVCFAGSARSEEGRGKLTGVVHDPAGMPQMGATVWLTPETAFGRTPIQLLSNEQGMFSSSRILPGLYSARVTLAGFLPTLQQHIRITANLTTVVHIELDSVFSSLDRLRGNPREPTEAEDWKWVLRTSAATRPVLQLREGAIVIAANSPDVSERQPRARLEMTNGSGYPGSPSALPGSLATAISYDQSLGRAGRVLVAGQMSYDQNGDANGSLGAALTGTWAPGGELGSGPETTLAVRQGRFGSPNGMARMMRFEHSEQMTLSDRITFEYGGEYVMGGVRSSTSAIRPRARVDVKASPHWTATFLLETNPEAYRQRANSAPLESAIDALGAFPLLLWREDGRTALSGGWHEELSAKRRLGAHRTIEAASFYDNSKHQAVFGFGPGFGPLLESGFDSPASIAHDAGRGGSLGARVVYKEKLSDNLELTAVYTWAGVLTPDQAEGKLGRGLPLEDMLRTRARHGVAGKISGKLPTSRTELAVGYKWLNGTAVSRQDLYGEAALGVDPYLSVSIRQPLPSFGPFGRWEALADVRNVLSQGCSSFSTEQGPITLVPVARSFRGGISVQF